MLSQNANRRFAVAPMLVSLTLLGMVACGKQRPSFQDDLHPEGIIPGGANPSTPNDATPNSSLQSVEKVFFATETAPGALNFRWGEDDVVQDITMTGQRSQDAVTHQQKIRAQKTEVFSQGSLDSNSVDVFNQDKRTMGVLDILVVVDNSRSMVEEQNNLSTKLAPLLQDVSQSDWKIGVVTTDPNDGCLRALINKSDPNYEQAFARAVTAGANGNGNERGILQAVRALEGNCAGGPWIRPNSTLAVLIVSDEDNCSDGQGCDSPDRSGDYLLNYLAGIREVGVNARVYGLVWHSSMSHDSCQTAYNRADIYSSVIDKSKGEWGSICSNDYTETLAKISTNISVILKTQFALKFAPLADQLEVFVNGQKITSGYHVTGKVVEFDTAPAEGSEIRFNYKYRAKEPQSKFTLMGVADAAALEVYIDGVEIDPAQFQFNEATHVIDFGTPPAGSEVKVVYRESAPLLENFAIPSGIDGKSIEVRVNDKVMDPASYQYNAAQNFIHFNQAPADGASIQISFSKVGGPQLNYPLVLGEVTGVTNGQGQAIDYDIEGKMLVISEAVFRSGEHLFVHYKSPIGADGVLPLQFNVLPETLEVKSDVSGVCAKEKIVIAADRINFSGCGFQAGEAIHVTFKYVVSHTTTFEMKEEPYTNPALPWVVTVNGEPTVGYQRNGGVLSFSDLPYGARVVVKVIMTKLH